MLSLLGTGLATVALGLLAFDLAGTDAGAVLGTALAIKMIAYVGIAPVAGAFVHLVPRRSLLVALAGAMVIVNTMVLVRAGFGLGAAELGWTLAAYGAGSMV